MTDIDILDNLNPEQVDAVTTTSGPVLILAGAGSGKTKALTHRIAYLICEKNVSPENILAVTFTNKASQEMISRVNKLLLNSKFMASRGISTSGNIIHNSALPWMGTFHSICVKILRQEIGLLGYTRGFSIYDSEESLSAVKHAMDALNIDKKQYNPRSIRNFISGAKNEMISASAYTKYGRGYFGEVVQKVYDRYEKDLKAANALDFDDLLVKTVEILEKDSGVLARYQDTFQYILIDEYQDTNHVQYRMAKLLAAKHQNICVVGDDFQCLDPKTKISMKSGQEKNIKDIEVGDEVLSANGYGTYTSARVERVSKRKHNGKIWQINTESGDRLIVSQDHMLFARLEPQENQFFVYLMYRKDKGYRIGLTRGIRFTKKANFKMNGLQVRAMQEKADRMWILQICDDESEARYFESYYAFKYGIPTLVFFSQGRNMKLNQKHIDQLYETIKTEDRVKELFKDMNLAWDYPHHRPQAVTLELAPIYQGRQVVTLNMFGEDRIGVERPWHAHRVRITTTDPKLREKFEQAGFITRSDKRSWRVETSRKNYAEALALAEKLAEVNNLDIVKTARLSGEKQNFNFMPASNLRAGMVIPILKNGKIVGDKIKSIQIDDYCGELYDLDIRDLHNYIAGGLVVHNSIYGFRGANFKNILDFEKDYPSAKVIKLEQNYRSTQNILAAAQNVIEKNTLRSKKTLWTKNEEGTLTTIYQAKNEIEEIEFVQMEIESLRRAHNLNDFVVLYRTNAQSRVLEEIFLQHKLPYRLIGALRFYERREVKDILAYLKLILNSKDRVSLKRIINVPTRGIGAKSQKEMDMENPKIKKFFAMMAGFESEAKLLKIDQLIDTIARETGYKNYILDGTEEGESRWENIEELKSVATKSETLEQFLESVALASDLDKLDRSAEAVTFMTLHNAKGLEFPIVFIVGMEEGLFPHANSLLDPMELEEERRLCYVGMTRAMERLYLTYAESRLLYGGQQYNIPSRFLSEVPEELVDRI